jgi:Ras-related protein Rab-18
MASRDGDPGSFDHLFKILLIGDASVGKSSLLLRFTEGTFEMNLQSTIGVDFKVKMMNVSGKRCKVTIWDTAGQERFRTLTSSYYRGAHGIILVRVNVTRRPSLEFCNVFAPLLFANAAQVYDVTRPETFEHLEAWLGEVGMYSPGGGKHVVKLLVGNKTDLDDRAVTTREGEAWARAHGCLFLEASAKSEDNVVSCFEEVIARILETPQLLTGTGPTPAVRPGIARLDVPKPDAPPPGAGGCCN